jgi:hypothetical protein
MRGVDKINEIISFGWFSMLPGENVYLCDNNQAKFICDEIEETIEVKDNKILSFWDKMDEINIWNWKNSYESNLSVTDGVQWNLELKSRHGKNLTSQGYNEFPRNFKTFIKEINYLYGIRIFNE